MSKTVPAHGADLEAILDEVVETHGEIVLTRDGKPVAKVIPLQSSEERTLESLRGSITILGDIVEPLDVEWDVLK